MTMIDGLKSSIAGYSTSSTLMGHTVDFIHKQDVSVAGKIGQDGGQIAAALLNGTGPEVSDQIDPQSRRP